MFLSRLLVYTVKNPTGELKWYRKRNEETWWRERRMASASRTPAHHLVQTSRDFVENSEMAYFQFLHRSLHCFRTWTKRGWGTTLLLKQKHRRSDLRCFFITFLFYLSASITSVNSTFLSPTTTSILWSPTAFKDCLRLINSGATSTWALSLRSFTISSLWIPAKRWPFSLAFPVAVTTIPSSDLRFFDNRSAWILSSDSIARIAVLAFFSAALDFCFFSSRKRKKARGRRHRDIKQKTYQKKIFIS